jgi:hypothetical protein
MASDKVSMGNGSPPDVERWPFSELKRGKYFEVTDLKQHTAVRTASTRAKKKLGKKFSVRKVTLTEDGVARQVIRVYLEK